MKIEADKVTETVKLIDWEHAENNDFAIVEEVTLHGNHERRPDLVFYVFVDERHRTHSGKRYLLHVNEADAPPAIQLRHKRMLLQVRPGASREKCWALVEEWYRKQIREAVSPLVERWEKRLGVKVDRIFVRRMKTKWGSCNPVSRSIRLNTDLAKKPPQCLEYIVVHELMHLLEPTHNARFQSLMDQHVPQWRSHRDTLNRLPVRHERWGY